MLVWYLGLARRRPLVAVLILVGAGVVMSVAARIALGDRGTLVPAILYLGFGLALSGWLGARFTRAAFDRTRDSRLVLILAVPLDAFAVFIAVQLVLATLDLALPFDTVDADVVSWQYHASGRGPGSTHLFTADGAEYEMPPLATYGGPEVAGRYRLELTRLERLVVSATPLR